MIGLWIYIYIYIYGWFGYRVYIHLFWELYYRVVGVIISLFGIPQQLTPETFVELDSIVGDTGGVLEALRFLVQKVVAVLVWILAVSCFS